MLYVYAVVAGLPRRFPPRRGAFREPVDIMRCGRMVVVIGRLTRAPALTARSLAAHDRVVREAAKIADAILPARFGNVFADEQALCASVVQQRQALSRALAVVRGREQMTVRIFVSARGPQAPRPEVRSSGAEYLRARAAAEGKAVSAALGPLRKAVGRYVRRERVETYDAPDLVATVFHLVDTGRARPYRAAVRRAAGRLRGMTLRVAGPHPPYAFTEAAG